MEILSIKKIICFYLATGSTSLLVNSFAPNHDRDWGTTNTLTSKKNILPLSPSDKNEKETTLERLTGPKLFKTVTDWNGIHSVPLVPLRIMTGLLMIHHGSEGGLLPANFGTTEFQGFIDFIIKPYFGFLPGPPELWSAIHDYVEYFGGICVSLGFLTRPASLSLLVTMISAVYFHLSAVGLQGFPIGHVSNYSYDFEEPTLYALIFLLFFFNGAVSSYLVVLSISWSGGKYSTKTGKKITWIPKQMMMFKFTYLLYFFPTISCEKN